VRATSSGSTGRGTASLRHVLPRLVNPIPPIRTGTGSMRGPGLRPLFAGAVPAKRQSSTVPGPFGDSRSLSERFLEETFPPPRRNHSPKGSGERGTPVDQSRPPRATFTRPFRNGLIPDLGQVPSPRSTPSCTRGFARSGSDPEDRARRESHPQFQGFPLAEPRFAFVTPGVPYPSPGALSRANRASTCLEDNAGGCGHGDSATAGGSNLSTPFFTRQSRARGSLAGHCGPAPANDTA
jgi:hypothetical protein